MGVNTLTLKETLFGHITINHREMINTIIILAKNFIWSSKNKQKCPSSKEFNIYLSEYYLSEKRLYTKLNKANERDEKWKFILRIIKTSN